MGIYVNCWQHRTLYSVLQAIIDQMKILRAEAQDTNFKFERIRQAIRGRPTVIILDEIDRPMPKQRDEIIYGLLSLPKTGLICVAGSTQPLAVMDERVRSGPLQALAPRSGCRAGPFRLEVEEGAASPAASPK